MPRNAIVVGMARSGTSLTASVFAKQGYFVTANPEADLYPANRINPGGFWEAQPLVDANILLLRRIGHEDHNTWRFSTVDEAKAAGIAQLEPTISDRRLVDEYDKHRPWVWKDPRLCYTLGYWWPLVDQNSTRVLLVRRDVESIFRSYCRIGWRKNSEINRQDVIDKISSHINAVERVINDLQIPHIVIDYRDYAKDSEKIAKMISKEFEVPLRSSDLGYTDRYNSSSLYGRIFRIGLEKTVMLIPRPVRRGLKRLIPRKLLRLLFPGFHFN